MNLAPLASGPDGPYETLRPLLAVVIDALCAGAQNRGGPIAPTTAAELDAQVREIVGERLPQHGTGPVEALQTLTEMLARGAADPADPACAAHLHTPPLAVAVAADLAVATLNPSLDSWDQSPAATALEPVIISALAQLAGYPPHQADGVVTSGGTESNMMGLLFARDHVVRERVGVDVTREGVPATVRPVVFCSGAAHFSISRNAGFLGLGEDSVIAVETDERQRMKPQKLRADIRRALAHGQLPVAVVATAGTTDLGSVDPLSDIADVAAEHGVWLHVDAAYGGGALFSNRLRGLLTGVQRADSVGLDLHKLGWQPVAAGVFLAKQAQRFSVLDRRVEYLISEDDHQAGYPSLLGHSLRTTRRADVFKFAVTLRALGTNGLGELVDRCHGLARYAARRVQATAGLRLHSEPTLSTVVFRYEQATSCTQRDRINNELRRRLLRAGSAVVGRTEFDDGVWLKFTLLNPHTRESDLDELIAAVVHAAEQPLVDPTNSRDVHEIIGSV